MCQQQPLWVVQDLQIHLAAKAGTCADTSAAMAVDLQTHLLNNIQSIYPSIDFTVLGGQLGHKRQGVQLCEYIQSKVVLHALGLCRWHRGDLQLHLASGEKADTHADTIAAMAVDLQTYLLKLCTGCADGIEEQGSSIMYKANVRKILTEGEGDKLKAVGVQLADGRIYRGQVGSVHIALLHYCLQV